MNDTLSLFSTCPLPGCKNLTEDPRQPCDECKDAFGDRLRPSGREVSAEEFAAELAEGDRAVAAFLAEPRGMVPLPERPDDDPRPRVLVPAGMWDGHGVAGEEQ